MSQTECTEQLELFEVGRQQVTMTFDGGDVVSDAGLLPVRQACATARSGTRPFG